MRRLPAAVATLVVALSVLFVGFAAAGRAQPASSALAKGPDMATVVAEVPQPGTGGSLLLLSYELGPRTTTGTIANDQSRILQVMQGEIRFSLTTGDATVFRGSDNANPLALRGSPKTSVTLKTGDRLSLTPGTTYQYENLGNKKATVQISAIIVPVATGTPPAALGPGTPHAAYGCLSGCSHP